ncbi:MAG: type II toxin-antitoxin system HicA family toxin [bacterium]
MGSWKKTLRKLLLGASDANMDFEAMCSMLRHVGFQQRTKGSHFIYSMEGVEEILNLQSKNGKGKPYQMKQVRDMLVKYKLAEQGNE